MRGPEVSVGRSLVALQDLDANELLISVPVHEAFFTSEVCRVSNPVTPFELLIIEAQHLYCASWDQEVGGVWHRD